MVPKAYTVMKSCFPKFGHCPSCEVIQILPFGTSESFVCDDCTEADNKEDDNGR